MEIPCNIPLQCCIYCGSTPRFEPAWNWFNLDERNVRVICSKCGNSTLYETWEERADIPPEQIKIDKQTAIDKVANCWNNQKLDFYIEG